MKYMKCLNYLISQGATNMEEYKKPELIEINLISEKVFLFDSGLIPWEEEDEPIVEPDPQDYGGDVKEPWDGNDYQMKTKPLKIIIGSLCIATVIAIGIANIVKEKTLEKQEAQSLDIQLEFDDDDYTVVEEDEEKEEVKIETFDEKEVEKPKQEISLDSEELEFDDDDYAPDNTSQIHTEIVEEDDMKVNENGDVVIAITDGDNSTAIVAD